MTTKEVPTWNISKTILLEGLNRFYTCLFHVNLAFVSQETREHAFLLQCIFGV